MGNIIITSFNIMTTDVVTQLWRELLYCLMLRTVRLSKQGTSIKIELHPSPCLFLFGYYNMPLHIWKTCSPYGFFWHRYAELATLSPPPPIPPASSLTALWVFSFDITFFFTTCDYPLHQLAISQTLIDKVER